MVAVLGAYSSGCQQAKFEEVVRTHGWVGSEVAPQSPVQAVLDQSLKASVDPLELGG